MIDSVSTFFSEIPSWQRTLILAGGLCFFWLLEGTVPLVNMIYHHRKHLYLNLFFTGTTMLVNFLFAVLIVLASDLTQRANIGVLSWIQMPVWLQIIVALMILDFIGAWLIHWLVHQVYWLWKFHIIHHSDRYVDASTALRHHPGESVFRVVFTLAAVCVAGAPIWLVMLYQTLSVFLAQFNHANVRLPVRIERALSLVLVTPRFHRVHHHAFQPFTDSNYGNIFSIWDRLLGTYQHLKTEEIKYGLDVYQEDGEHVGELLKVPVDHRNYRRVEREEQTREI